MDLTTLRREQNYMMNQWITSRPIAHRGYHYQGILENSKDSFLLAIKYRLNIECDVRLTKDNIVVVFHDNDLLRLFNDERKVSDLTLIEMKQISDNQILSLQELLDLVQGQVGLVIEIKTESIFQSFTEKVITVMDNYNHAFALKSFNMFSLLRIQRLRPDFLIGKVLQKDKSLKNFFNQVAGFFVTEDFNSISYQRPVTRKRSVPQLNWTITSLEDFKKVKVPIFEQIPEDELLTIYNPDLYELLDEPDSLE